jgi:hypothetical protein
MSWENKINKETIVEDYKKRFSTILEYTFREINEADDDTAEEDTEAPAEGEEDMGGMSDIGGDMSGGDMGDIGGDMGDDGGDLNASLAGDDEGTEEADTEDASDEILPSGDDLGVDLTDSDL